MSQPKRFSSSAVLSSSQLIVTGGEKNNIPSKTVEVFDLKEEWFTKSELPVTISRHCMVKFDESKSINI